jgi:hypothetical protein
MDMTELISNITYLSYSPAEHHLVAGFDVSLLIYNYCAGQYQIMTCGGYFL